MELMRDPRLTAESLNHVNQFVCDLILLIEFVRWRVLMILLQGRTALHAAASRNLLTVVFAILAHPLFASADLADKVDWAPSLPDPWSCSCWCDLLCVSFQNGKTAFQLSVTPEISQLADPAVRTRVIQQERERAAAVCLLSFLFFSSFCACQDFTLYLCASFWGFPLLSLYEYSKLLLLTPFRRIDHSCAVLAQCSICMDCALTVAFSSGLLALFIFQFIHSRFCTLLFVCSIQGLHRMCKRALDPHCRALW